MKCVLILLMFPLLSYSQTNIDLLDKQYKTVLSTLKADTTVSQIKEMYLPETKLWTIAYTERGIFDALSVIYFDSDKNAIMLSSWYDYSYLNSIMNIFNQSLVKQSEFKWANYNKQNTYYSILKDEKSFAVLISHKENQ